MRVVKIIDKNYGFFQSSESQVFIQIAELVELNNAVRIAKRMMPDRIEIDLELNCGKDW